MYEESDEDKDDNFSEK